jgi:hypothetical protein
LEDSLKTRFAAALVAVVATIAVLAPTAAAALTLRVASVSDPPSNAAAGGRFAVSFKAARRGAGLRKATLAFYLSPGKSKSREAVRLGGRKSLANLRRKRSLKGRTLVRLPASIRPGSYYLLACIQKVRGRGAPKRAVCRAAKQRLTVPAPSPAPPVTGDGAGGASGTGGTGGTADTGGPGGGGSGSTIDPARGLEVPNPRNVTPTLEAARAAKATIGSAGGTLSATGANGTKFTLTIPANALAGDTEIVMTPIASIGGLPFDRLVGAVDLKPEGVRFYRPVRLTFEPTSPVPLDRQSPFVYSGSGQDLRNYGLVADPVKLEMTLVHFTGAGVADGTAGQRSAQQARPPANYEGQFEQRGAPLASDLRDGKITADEFNAQWTALNRQYYEAVVKPRLAAAETNDELGELAISTFLGWARQLELLGASESFQAELDAGSESMRRILENAYRKAFQRCVGGEIGQIQRMLGFARTAQLLGLDFGDDIDDKIDRCLRFSLDYEYDSTCDSPGLKQATLRVRSLGVPLRFNFADGVVEGSVPLTVTRWEWYDYICDQVGGTAAMSRPGSARLEIQPGNPIEERRADGSVRTTFPPPRILGLQLDPGELDTRNACGLNGFSGGYYGDDMRWLYPDLHDGTTGQLTVKPWTFVGASPWATFGTSRTVHPIPSQTYTGDMRFTLRHTPAPG